jgi:HAD superfamily hydrolase (TIGR01509 family)
LLTVDGLTEFLEQIEKAELPIALASSASRGRVEYSLERFDLYRRFQMIVTGDDVTRGKPDPTIFLVAADGLGLDPRSILVCEDAVNGVEAAKTAGMKCLAIAANGRGPILEKAGADRVVPDFTTANLEDLRALFDHA